MIYDSQVNLQLWARLGPRTLYQSTGTWTNVFSSNRIQRNNKGLKPTSDMHSRSKLWTVRYKKATSQPFISEMLGAKAGYHTWPLHTAPPWGWADHLKLCLLPNSPTGLHPHPHFRSQGTCYLFSLRHAAAQIPTKACLNSHPTSSIYND